MTIQDLIELAERCEKAAEGSREIDALIEIQVRRWQAYAAGLNDKQRAYWSPVGTKGEVESQGCRYHAPLYSRSYDAAVELLPKKWQAILYTETQTAELYNAGLKKRAGIKHRSKASTLILALCAAAIRARASLKGEG